MPRTKRSGPARRGRAALDDDDRDMLLIGDCFFRSVAARSPKDAGLRRLWELHGARLLADAIEVCPGGRPWAWWQYDAPDEPRAPNEPPLAWLFRVGEVDANELKRWEANRREHAAAVARDMLAWYGIKDAKVPETLPEFVTWWRERISDEGPFWRELHDEPWHRLQV